MSRFETPSFPGSVWDGLYTTFNSLETDQYLNVDGKDRVTKEIQAVEQYLVDHAPTLSFFEHTTPARALVTVDDAQTGLKYRTLANGANIQINYVNDTIVVSATGGGNGSAFTWQGSWNNATFYLVDDVVEDNGSSYICIQANVNETTANTSAWNLMAQKGTDGANGTNGVDGANGTNGVDGANGVDGTDGISFVWQGAWDANATYVENDVVFDAGSSYINILASNGSPTSNTTYWNLMAQKGDTGPDIITTSTDTNGPANSILASDGSKISFRTLIGTGGITVTPSTNSYTIAGLSGITQEPTGFPDRITTTLSVNNTSREFIITPTANSFDIYLSGVKTTKLAAETFTVPNSVGLHLVYYDVNGVLASTQTSEDFLHTCQVASFHWNGTYAILGDERHGIAMDHATHEYLHETLGTRYESGLTLSGYTIDVQSDAAVKVGLDGGRIHDEDLDNIITNGVINGSFRQPIAYPASLPVYYRSGLNGPWFKDTATQFPFKPFGVDTIAYNSVAGSTWGQTVVSNTDYIASWVVATNNPDEPIIVIQGQRSDGTLANALTNNLYPNLQLGSLPSLELKILYRLIYQFANSYSGTYRCRLRDVVDFRNVASPTSSGYTVVDHGTLAGLQDQDHGAAAIFTDTTTFGGVLTTNETDVQLALNKLDDHTHAGLITGLTGGRVPYVSNATTIIDSTNFTWNNGTSTLTVPNLSASTKVTTPQVSATASSDLTLVPGTGKNIVLSGQKFPNANGSNTQVLQTNGNGVLAWADMTAISGLTTGRIPYAANATSLTDNANLTFDGTNFFTYSGLITHIQTTDITSPIGSPLVLTGGSGTNAVQISTTLYPTVNGSANQVLRTNGAGTASWSTVSEISGLTATRIPYASNGTTLVDTANLTWDGTYLVTPNIRCTSVTGSVGSDLYLNGDTGKNVIVGPLKVPLSDGSAGQYLKTDGSGNLGYVTPGYVSTISSNTTYYISTTGSDANAGTSGSPWATVGKALSYLGEYRIAAGVVATIQLADGHYTEDITPTHLQGSQISIVGEHTYTKVITTLQSVTGNSTTGYFPIINVNDVANVATNDFILIPANIGKGTPDTIRSQALAGVFQITNVDTVNKRLTLYSRYRYTSFPTTTGQTFDTGTSVTIIKTNIYSSAGKVLSIQNGCSIGLLDKIVLCGGDSASNVNNTGIYLDTQGNLTCGASVGIAYCYYGAYVVRGSVLSAFYLASCNNAAYGLYTVGGLSLISYGNFNGNGITGLYNASSSVTGLYATYCGNAIAGIDCLNVGSVDASASIANENMGSFNAGVYAHGHSSVIFTSGRANYNDYGLLSQTNSFIVGISATVSNNRREGMVASYKAMINIPSATIQSNVGVGCYADYSSFVRAGNGTITLNNSNGAQTSPTANTAGNVDSYVYLV